MLGDLVVIWVILMILSGVVRAASNHQKKQAILDQQYREALRAQGQQPVIKDPPAPWPPRSRFVRKDDLRDRWQPASWSWRAWFRQ